MSSSDVLRLASAKLATVRLASVFALALSAGGCLQPLYGEAAHPGLVEEMRAIQIAEINQQADKGPAKSDALGINPELDRQDRVGHYLRNDLIFNFNGTGTPGAPKYKLTIKTKEDTTTPTIESQIGAASSATATITAKYELAPYGGGAPIISSEATSSAVYDMSINRFSNLRAARDAEIRVAKSLADEIELRIAAALADKQSH
jgi:LPS-assembly lipoprotein